MFFLEGSSCTPVSAAGSAAVVASGTVAGGELKLTLNSRVIDRQLLDGPDLADLRFVQRDTEAGSCGGEHGIQAVVQVQCRLADKLATTFAGLQSSLDDIIGSGRKTLRLAVCSSFGPGWLIPRLSSFYAAQPDIDLSQLTAGHAELLSRYVREALHREIANDNPVLTNGAVLAPHDVLRVLNARTWRTPWETGQGTLPLRIE